MPKKRKKNVVSIDFTDVEGSNLVSDGEKLVGVYGKTIETGESSGAEYIAWEFIIKAPEEEAGRKLYTNTSLQPQSLWVLRNLLEAAGMEVPQQAMDIDLNDFDEDTELGVMIENEKYKGKDKPNVVDFIPVNDLEIEGLEPSEEDTEGSEEEGDEEGWEEIDFSKISKGDNICIVIDEEETTGEIEAKTKTSLTIEGEKYLRKNIEASYISTEEDDGEIEVGTNVSFEDEGEIVYGEVTLIKGDVATVNVDGEDWEVDLEVLSIDTE